MPNSPNVSTHAILRVAHPELLWRRVGGMLVLERLFFTISRARFSSVFVTIPEPDAARLAALRLPPGLEIRWADGDTAAPIEGSLEISADHLVRVEVLAAARQNSPMPDGSRLHLAASPSQGQIMDWLMQVGPKPQDGFMARHFDRHLSLAVSRALLDTTITPNQMTVFSTMIGLTGASLFLGDTRLCYVTGALLIWLHSVLDGCDGELARVRFQESSFGSDLDFWGDNLVHLALFTCLGVGFWLSGHQHTVLLAGVADAGVLASAWTAWGHRRATRARGPEAGVVNEPAGDGIESKLSRMENALAQRDFIYLLVLLAFLDMVYEFLWAAAIGGCLYFAIMLYLRSVNQNEQARQPHPVL